MYIYIYIYRPPVHSPPPGPSPTYYPTPRFVLPTRWWHTYMCNRSFYLTTYLSIYEHGNDSIFYRAVEPDSPIAVLRHFGVFAN